MEKFFNLSEVARLLRVSPLTVKRWVTQGKLAAFHPPGTRLYRVSESELKKFVSDEWWEKLFASYAEMEKKAAEERRVRRRRK
ncbi:MAG: helix-turn-helix domain-containing protein [Candidatus Fervidibacter sp.]|uniref:helix-turn-helix domain-containing protein n=1 Tax=Candidatus Fervidibacter sp. TaxID=3100871 RepID=UPI00404B2B65